MVAMLAAELERPSSSLRSWGAGAGEEFLTHFDCLSLQFLAKCLGDFCGLGWIFGDCLVFFGEFDVLWWVFGGCW